MDNTRLSQVLALSGYNLTRQRREVFAALLGQEPLTMRELISRVSSKVDRVSVYRTVALFENLGILQRLAQGFKYKLELSDSFDLHHHHLTCVNCGKLVDISGEKLESSISDIAGANGFMLRGHQVEIQGICTKCQQLTQ